MICMAYESRNWAGETGQKERRLGADMAGPQPRFILQHVWLRECLLSVELEIVNVTGDSVKFK